MLETAAMPMSLFAPAVRRVVIGIGEYAVSDDADATLITHALGSCVAVCLWDPDAHVAGLIHVLLPDSKINLARAAQQPAAFADTGIPLLFRSAYERGAMKKRCRVQLIGGAEVTASGGQAIGKRNVLAARQLLWRNGVTVDREMTGGTAARTVFMSVETGDVRVSTAGDRVG